MASRVTYLSEKQLNVVIEKLINELNNEDKSGPIKDSSSSGKCITTLLQHMCEKYGVIFSLQKCLCYVFLYHIKYVVFFVAIFYVVTKIIKVTLLGSEYVFLSFLNPSQSHYKCGVRLG